MKTLAVIKNELFKDYLKIISTSDLASALDNPSVPVPFTCVVSVENKNADALVEQLNFFFNHRKLANKDFFAFGEDDMAQLSFMFNLIKLSDSGSNNAPNKLVLPSGIPPKSANTTESEPVTVKTPVIEKSDAVEPTIDIIVEKLIEPTVDEKLVPISSFSDMVDEIENNESILIEPLGISKNSTIHFIKNDTITATLVDEKTVILDGETLSIIDATKKAFKKSGTTGMALGLANWNFEGTSLKALKDKNS